MAAYNYGLHQTFAAQHQENANTWISDNTLQSYQTTTVSSQQAASHSSQDDAIPLNLRQPNQHFESTVPDMSKKWIPVQKPMQWQQPQTAMQPVNQQGHVAWLQVQLPMQPLQPEMTHPLNQSQMQSKPSQPQMLMQPQPSQEYVYQQPYQFQQPAYAPQQWQLQPQQQWVPTSVQTPLQMRPTNQYQQLQGSSQQTKPSSNVSLHVAPKNSNHYRPYTKKPGKAAVTNQMIAKKIDERPRRVIDFKAVGIDIPEVEVINSNIKVVTNCDPNGPQVQLMTNFDTTVPAMVYPNGHIELPYKKIVNGKTFNLNDPFSSMKVPVSARSNKAVSVSFTFKNSIATLKMFVD